MNGKYWRKGSMTIEASLLMGVILLVVMGILYLFFHVHNRAWLTEAACEAAVTCTTAAAQGQDAYAAAAFKSHLLEGTGFIGGQDLHSAISVSTTVNVSYRMNTASVFGGFVWPIEVSAGAVLTDPVAWIRGVRSIGHVLKSGD